MGYRVTKACYYTSRTPCNNTTLDFQITAFVVIPMTINRGILCACLIIGGFIFFLIVSKVGQKLLEREEAKIEAEKEKNVQSLSVIS